MLAEELVSIWKFKTRDAALKRARHGVEMLRSSLFQLGLATAAASAAIGGVLKLAGEREQVKISFEVMLKDGEKAKALLEDLIRFADVTPYETNQVINVGKQLLAAKYTHQEIMELMKSMGDVAAGLGGGQVLDTLTRALFKIKAMTKSSMEELRMMAEQGAPVLDALAKQLNVSTAQMLKLLSAGKITAKNVEDAIHKMAKEDFLDMMIKQSKTLFGLWSTIMGQMKNHIAEAGQYLLPVWKDLMGQYIKWYAINKKMLMLKTIKFFEKLSTVVRFGIQTFRSLWNIADSIAQAIGGWQVVFGAIAVLFVSKVAVAIGMVATGLKGLVALMWAGNLAALPLTIKFWALGLGIIALGLAINSLIVWMKGGETMFDWILAWIANFNINLDNALDKLGKLGTVLKWLSKIIPLTAIPRLISTFVDKMAEKRAALQSVRGAVPYSDQAAAESKKYSSNYNLTVNLPGATQSDADKIADTIEQKIKKYDDQKNREAIRDGYGVYAI